ncbi:MAG: hypothetical protein M1272_02410 [Firmicutes bacterium]|nr:hypothetical protein [Bacillota bacterium]
MRTFDAVKNQIVYLTYVLSGFQDGIDAEVLRPIWDNLRHLPVEELPDRAQGLRQRTEEQVARWLDLGMSLSRQSIERVLESLKLLLRELTPQTPSFNG